ncbi:EAL domain-containing protein [Uliginosibacterium sp. H3]|uniref:EAL domain-containing protein n=1 Tax=Uliginosibacterium silvisoli TaxID=3114758 RepID=A0ABU6JZT2_9RHOO|nr:EAL domain-containing protein [Uliginosibacterium sp. H3]
MFSRISLWLGRLSVGRKLTLIYLLDLTAVIYISGILIHEKYLAIDFARKEISGTVYAEAVRQNLMDAFLGTTPSALTAFDDASSRFDETLKTGEQSQRMRSLLLQHGDTANNTALLMQGRELLTSVGNQSNLILDPDLDSYYVMSLTLLRFPELLQVLYDNQNFMRQQSEARLDPNRTGQLLAMAGRLDAVLQGIESDYTQTWLAASPALKAALSTDRQRLLQDANAYLAAVKFTAYETSSAASEKALEQAYQRALGSLSTTWKTGIAQMQILLQARVESLFRRMWLHLGTALLLLGGILSMVYLVASQIARPLQSLARVADKVRRTADYSQRANWHARDEIGQLVHAFNDMLAQLDKDRRLQQELAASARAAEAQRELVEAFPIPMVVTSVPDHEVLHANQPALPWLGEGRGDPWRKGLEAGVRSRFFQRLADINAVDEFEVRWHGGNAPTWAVLSARRLVFQGRDAVLTAFTPVNKLKVMEQRLELWAKVFEASSESIIIMDETRKIISVNNAFCRSTGHGFYEVIGQDLSVVLQSPQEMDWRDLQTKESWQGEVHIRRQSGGTYPAWLMVSAVHKGVATGEVVNYIAISIDITDRKAKEDRIRFLAQHDVLTELPNRALCQQRLSEALEQAAVSGEKVALLFIDLDRFKLINDTLGHHVGDGLLRAVARRLSHAVRTEDTVSRLGGDEFVLILRHVTDLDELNAMINQRLIPSIRQTTTVEGHALTVSCSVGVALYPDDAQDLDALMRRADAAMYEAKSAGRDMARFFSPETDHRVLARQTMEVQLRQALAAGEFSLHFQPRLQARSRKVQGVEALLRWQNPLLGEVPPDNFIQLAEETGLINRIGAWVLREACTTWMDLEARGICKGLTLSVNLSVAQLAHPELVEQLAQVLHETGMPAEQLELELTESHLMDNPDTAQARVSALKELGVQIAIDDFGTGYSSLAYLKRFELDKLKVDQSFVLGMMEDSADAAIVHAVIGLGHTLGLAVVAEGVENLATAQALTALGCDELQGYCFSRPLPLDELVSYLQTNGQHGERRRMRA